MFGLAKTTDNTAEVIVSALDIVKSHPLLSGENADPEFAKLVFEKTLEHEIKRKQTASDRAKWRHSTPLAIALTGLIAIGANFAVDYFRDTQDFSQLLTEKQFDAKIAENNTKQKLEYETQLAKMNQLINEQNEEAKSQRSAKAKQLEFQYKIIEHILESNDEARRAETLLFLVRAGVLENLNTTYLDEVASRSIRKSGGNPEDIGVPQISGVPNSLGGAKTRLLEKVVLSRQFKSKLDACLSTLWERLPSGSPDALSIEDSISKKRTGRRIRLKSITWGERTLSAPKSGSPLPLEWLAIEAHFRSCPLRVFTERGGLMIVPYDDKLMRRGKEGPIIGTQANFITSVFRELNGTPQPPFHDLPNLAEEALAGWVQSRHPGTTAPLRQYWPEFAQFASEALFEKVSAGHLTASEND